MKHNQSLKNVVIREFTMRDYDDVLSLWDDGKIHYRQQGRDSCSRIEKELKGGRAIFLVAEAGDHVVGTVLGTHDGRKGWINRLAVNTKLRRQDIARRLVTEAEKRLAEFGIEVIACLIEEDNSASMRFFEKLGYSQRPIAYYSKRPSPDA